ncbi:MAG: RNA polymerase sigma-70 factor [Marinifilaceae bacterium]
MYVKDSNDYDNFVALSRGDKKAFECLFNKYYEPLYEYSCSLVGDGDKAADIVQEVFIYLWDHRASIKIHASIKSYLYTSARHASINQLNKMRLEQRHENNLTEFIEFLQTTSFSEEEQARVNSIYEAMATLPKQCQHVFMLSAIEGKKYQEIADELGLSINTVKTHIVKAYKRIRSNTSSSLKLLIMILGNRNKL